MKIQNASFYPPPNAQPNNARTSTQAVNPQKSVDKDQRSSASPVTTVNLRSQAAQANRVVSLEQVTSTNDTPNAVRDSGHTLNANTQSALARYQQFENIEHEENLAQLNQVLGIDLFA